MNFLRLSLFFLSLLGTELGAKTFTSQYCQFELPTGWECALEGTEWVCQSVNEERKKEAIIILAAKVRGKKDSLEQYLAYLKKTKTFSMPNGKTQVSDPKYAKLTPINDHRWIDSLHLASEVPGFYTRYMATVKEDLGIAVTFSVSKNHYDSYRNIFDRVIQTLRVFRQKKFNPSQYQSAGIKGKDKDLIKDAQFIPDMRKKYGIGYGKQGGAGSKGGPLDALLWIVLIAVAVVFILLRLRKKKK